MDAISNEALLRLFENEKIFVVDESIFSGKNQKQIVVMCRCGEGREDLSKDELERLKKILASVNLSFDDVALVLSHRPFAFAFLNEEIEFSKMLVFGFSPGEIKIGGTFGKNTLFEFEGKMLLFSANISELINSEVERKKLWTDLKNLFLKDKNV